MSYINYFFKYIYLFVGFLALISAFLAVKTEKISKQVKLKPFYVKKKKDKFSSIIRRYKFTNLLIGNLGNRISLITKLSQEISDFLAVLVWIAYFLCVRCIYCFSEDFYILWYLKLVNLINSMLIPIIIFNIFTELYTNKLYKQLPTAFCEISSAYRSKMRLKEAIEEAILYMPYEIRKEFERFYNYIQSDMTFDEGLNYLKNKIPYYYTKTFCAILEIGREKNSDISKQLDNLSVLVRTASYNREKSHKKMIFFKILSLGFIIAIPFVMRFCRIFDIEAYNFYYTLEGSILLSVTLLAALLVHLVISLLEKNI